jgi:hypothetical protein
MAYKYYHGQCLSDSYLKYATFWKLDRFLSLVVCGGAHSVEPVRVNVDHWTVYSLVIKDYYNGPN